MNKTYLVTGGAGFIGSNLIERLLKERNKVIVIDNFCDFYDVKLKEKNIESFIDNNNFKLYKLDIRNKRDIKKVFDENNVDCVIHLAAMAGVRPSIDNPIFYQEVNCMGTQIILEEAILHNIKNFILASSSSVYGNNANMPFKEDMSNIFPISPYAFTKSSNELMGHVYHKLYNINIIFLRFFTVYGPRQRPDLAINKFTNLLLNDEEIPLFGDGTTFRDYTYIDDIVDGICKSCNYIFSNKNVYEIINLGSGNPIKLIDMVNIIADILNVKPKIKYLPINQGDVNGTWADISKAKKILGYEPKTKFQDGVKKFIDWHNNNFY